MATSVIDNKEQKLLRMEKYEGTQLTRRAVPHIAEAPSRTCVAGLFHVRVIA